ncbi:MAG: hypothetical protein ACOC9H_00310 [Gemmatimonadota bacterium]
MSSTTRIVASPPSAVAGPGAARAREPDEASEPEAALEARAGEEELGCRERRIFPGGFGLHLRDAHRRAR